MLIEMIASKTNSNMYFYTIVLKRDINAKKITL